VISSGAPICRQDRRGKELRLNFGNDEDLHLVPVAAGRSKGKWSTGKIIIGVAHRGSQQLQTRFLDRRSKPCRSRCRLAVGWGISFGFNRLIRRPALAAAGASMLLTNGACRLKGYSKPRISATARQQSPRFLFNIRPRSTVVSQGATIPVICGLKIRNRQLRGIGQHLQRDLRADMMEFNPQDLPEQ